MTRSIVLIHVIRSSCTVWRGQARSSSGSTTRLPTLRPESTRRCAAGSASSPPATSVLDAYVYGFALTERGLPFDPVIGADVFADEFTGAWDDYPHLAELVGELTRARDHSFANEFEVGLDIILDELESRLAAEHQNGKAAPLARV